MTAVAPGKQPLPVFGTSREAEDVAARLLMRLNAPEANARLVAESLVAADLEGVGSHGLMLLPMYLDRIAAGSVSPTSEGHIVSKRGGAIVFDAENGLGQVTSAHAVKIANEAASTHGIGAVAVRNGFHFGTAGRWAAALAREGCVGIALSNTRPLMPPPGGSERIVGNNPIAIAVPSKDGGPLVVDLALSAVAMGRIRLAQAAGEPIPTGWACDEAGEPTTDPATAIKGMLLPAAGPKGFGLAMMIDLLAGGLSSGAVGEDVKPLYGAPNVPYSCAHFFLALNIAAFRMLEEFEGVVAAFANRVRASRPAPGIERVMAPGDPAIRARAEAQGLIRLEESTIKSLRDAAAKFGVEFNFAPRL